LSVFGRDPAEVEALADHYTRLRVATGRPRNTFANRNIKQAIMAGQIAPGNLFDLRPDMKALVLLGPAQGTQRESIFGAIADELAKAGVELPARTTFLRMPAGTGHIAGPKLSRQQLAMSPSFPDRKEISPMDIGQASC